MSAYQLRIAEHNNKSNLLIDEYRAQMTSPRYIRESEVIRGNVATLDLCSVFSAHTRTLTDIYT